jgi:hypothetical protein
MQDFFKIMFLSKEIGTMR